MAAENLAPLIGPIRRGSRLRRRRERNPEAKSVRVPLGRSDVSRANLAPATT